MVRRGVVACTVGLARAALAAAETACPAISIWRYAYIVSRRPSLTFLTVRPRAGAADGIERYLQSMRFK